MSQVAMIAEPIQPIDKIEVDDLSLGSLAITTDNPAILSAAQIIAGVRNRFDQLSALEVEDEFITESFEEDDRLVPFGRCHYAFSGSKRLKSQSGQFVEDGPCVFPHAIWAWNGNLQQNLQTFDQCAYISADKDDWVENSIYLGNAGIPVGSLDEEIKRLKNSCMRTWVIELFDSRRRWKVLSNLEIVDDAHCHVLADGGQYKLWIDANLGFATRVFEIYSHATASKAERPLLNRVVYRDFRRMHDDFWAPWLTVSACYDAEQKVRSICTDKVRKMATNSDVADGLFTLQYPPSTTIRDQVRKRFYRLDGQNDEINLGDWE